MRAISVETAWKPARRDWFRWGYIPPFTLEVLNEAGISTDGLYSKGLSEVALDDIDYLVNLTELKLTSLYCPLFSGKLISCPVRDPFGEDIESYREAREELEWLVRKKLPVLIACTREGARVNCAFVHSGLALVLVILFSTALVRYRSAVPPDLDTIIKNGLIYDGSGGAPFKADVGIKADRIAAVGDLSGASAGTVIDAKGLAVAPGFINMLSWSTVSLIIDGRSQSELRQGVTTEIFGEGESMGPLTEEMKRRTISAQGEIKFDIAWTTLCEYLSYLEKRGISPNVASFRGRWNCTGKCHRPGEQKGDPGSTRQDVRTGSARDGGRGVGRRLLTGLRAGYVRNNR